jgi:glycogen operon protein
MAGSSLQFNHAGKDQGPARSLNFITAHDGFTLRDLVSYSRKHNHANGENNRDGNDDNRSANHGAEGETADPAINATRLAQMQNMLAALLLAQGTPMLLAGDEFGHTQRGNNNPYCLEIPLDWARLATPEGKALHETAKALIALRRENPALASETFLHARACDAHGVADLTWWHPSGREMTSHDWHEPGARVLGIVFNNAACAAKAPSRLLAVFNAGAHPAAFSLPALPGGGKWEPALPGTPAPGRALAGRSFAVYRQAVAPAA